MKQPIRVTVDPSCSVAYVEYRNLDKEGHLMLRVLREPDGRVEEYGRCDGRTGVHVDLNAHDDIGGSAIIEVDEGEFVAIAWDDARDNDLAFPDDIRAAAAAGKPAA